LKILFILHLPPPLHGPAVIGDYIRQSALINSEFECQYINLSLSSSLNDIGAASYSKFFRYLKIIWNLKKQLIFNRPDLCYITLNSKGTGFYKDALIAVITKVFGVKRIYHFHNKGITDRETGFFEDLLYRIVFRNSDVILISELLYYDFRKYVPEKRVYYCTNGIPEFKGPVTDSPLPVAMGSATGSTGLIHGTLNPETVTTCRLLFLSNLYESKGVYILLEACKILKAMNLKFHCTFSGGEGDITEQQLSAKAGELDIGDYISYEGIKLDKEKNIVFSEADIFVHPSYSDCLPLVILEAMQNSLPVISTFEGAIPDAVEDGITGFLVPVKDPLSVAGKLEILINDPDLRIRMGREGRARYEQKFILEIFEKRLAEILKEVIEKDHIGS
jgi:glycosyltransferase involved in cell wall biosynthesis